MGVNKFQSKEYSTIPGFKIDDSIREVQCNKLRLLKARRDNVKVKSCLVEINDAAVNNINLMPFIIEAVENYCTLGEISDELRKVFGEHK